MTLPVFPAQIALTFSIVFAVIVYRITTAAALSLNKATRSNVRVTVTATAVIINLVVILILDEIYGAVAKWLTKIGTVPPRLCLPQASLNMGAYSMCTAFGVIMTQHEKKNGNDMLCRVHLNVEMRRYGGYVLAGLPRASLQAEIFLISFSIDSPPATN